MDPVDVRDEQGDREDEEKDVAGDDYKNERKKSARVRKVEDKGLVQNTHSRRRTIPTRQA